MIDTDKFEEKLDRLIELCQQLKSENQALREREADLVDFQLKRTADQKIAGVNNAGGARWADASRAHS